MAESDRWQIAEASLFSDPRFRNAEKLGEFGRVQQTTRVAEASSRDTLAQHQGEQRAFERLERGDARRELGQEFGNRFENQTPCARWVGYKLVDGYGWQSPPDRDWVRRLVRHRRPLGIGSSPHPHTHPRAYLATTMPLLESSQTMLCLKPAAPNSGSASQKSR